MIKSKENIDGGERTRRKELEYLQEEWGLLTGGIRLTGLRRE